MATVTLLRNFDMDLQLPTSGTPILAEANANYAYSEWQTDSSRPFYVQASGTFSVAGPFTIEGTITRVLIDGLDAAFGPDLDITGVSHFVGVAWTSLRNSGDVRSFVADLLAGNDTVVGSPFSDPLVLLGFSGNDTLIGGKNGDELDGGAGSDTASYATSGTGLVANLANPGLNTGDADGDSYTSIENLIGSRFNDSLVGNNSGNVLTGGLGRDIMFGNLGADRFDFNSIKESVKGGSRDQILHFQRGTDDIDLRDIDAKSGSGNQDFKFIGKQDFHDKKGELRYEDNGSKVIVQGDINGDGKADFEIFVNVGALAKGDFIL